MLRILQFVRAAFPRSALNHSIVLFNPSSNGVQATNPSFFTCRRNNPSLGAAGHRACSNPKRFFPRGGIASPAPPVTRIRSQGQTFKTAVEFKFEI
jgi:hypothetical protein